MNVLSLILVALQILKSVLPQLTSSQVPAEVLAHVQEAIRRLEAVKDSPVTRDQLAGLRLEKLW